MEIRLKTRIDNMAFMMVDVLVYIKLLKKSVKRNEETNRIWLKTEKQFQPNRCSYFFNCPVIPR
ncbi:hypothetical protein D1614_09160 [Maribellus luteus]|uniref:Uncharacterized protein n=1 Tax=Maribellus luteus TaxID=2305463 RepID=A0A399T3C8_9BACT|nr:hypothetical protein D1614_09160 [Maribellus luteus]